MTITNTNKITSTALVLSFLFACNFCLLECAFAAEEHNHSAHVNDSTGHQHESEGNQEQSGSEKHDATSLCCSSLVATKNSQSYSTNIKFVKDLFSKTVVFERFVLQLDAYPKYEIEFPPGASLPEVFVLTHFTHAPPVSL